MRDRGRLRTEPPRGLSRSVEGAISRTVIGANLAGALVVYLYLQFLSQGIIDPHVPPSLLPVSLGAFSAYFVLATALVLLGMRATSRAGRSLEEDHPPNAEVRRIMLGVPRRITAFTSWCWVGAAGLYAALDGAFGEPGAQVVHVVVGILLAAVVTTAVTYLLAERLNRPVVVQVLGGHPPADRRAAIRGRLLVAWLVGSAVPLLALGLTPLVHASHAFVSLQVSIASLAALGLVVGYLVTSATAASVSEPLDSVRRALSAVRRGDLSVQVEVDDAGEIGRLEADVNSMVVGLRERRRLEELFGRHVGREVASQALSEEAVLGGRQLQASVLFVDLIGSTALAASRPPDQLVTLLNRLFSRVVQAVTEEGGWVNKFEGDGALCVFGAPRSRPDHAAAALRAARRLHETLAEAARSDPALDAGIGVAGGTVVAGNIGAVDRYEYTVIGDPVNEAARLSELAKTTAGRLLASATAVSMAGALEQRHWEPQGEAVLRGRRRPTVVMRPASEVAGGRRLEPPEGQPPASAGTIETV